MPLRELEGKKPRIHPTAFVSETAYLLGEVVVGEDSTILPGVVIRADRGTITIGKGSNIQDNSVIHSDTDATYGDGVTLGHRVMCHARTVGNNVLIGNGAVVNDGAVIGEDSIIASGAVVLENTVIPPGSMVVGVPGKVIGPTQEKHKELIHTAAKNYIGYNKRYKKQGGIGST